MHTLRSALLAIVLGFAVTWIALLAALWLGRPDEVGLKATLRLLPDLLRLVKRLATDSSLPRGVQIRLVLLLAYLAMPIDLIPDFIPVIGYADDAIVVSLALRSVARRAGPDAIERHWPGTPEGLAALRRVLYLPEV